MATGDILSAQIVTGDNKSWYAEITIEGLSTGGAYDFGFDSDILPEDAKVRFNLTRESFTNAGVATTINQVIYGIVEKHQYWDGTDGSADLIDEEISGTDVIVRVALSDWIYSGDVVTVDIDSGFYTEAATPNNAVTGLSVTNNSSADYQPPIAHWSVPLQGRMIGFNEMTLERDTSGYYEVRVKAYHRDGTGGQSCPCIKITGTGQTSGYVETLYLTSESIDQDTYSDALPITEFIGQLPVTGFTQGELVDFDFIAYPTVGDTTSVVDTSVNALTYSMPTYRPVTQTLVCDTAGTYGVAVAVCDITNGDDTLGECVDFDSFDPDNPPAAFQNTRYALNALKDFNLSEYGRDEFGGIVYLQAGDYYWQGTYTTTGTSSTYTIMTPFPGVDRGDVDIPTAASWYQYNIQTYFMTNGISYSGEKLTSAAGTWAHNCYFNAPSGGFCTSDPGVQYYTACTFDAFNQAYGPRLTQETYTFFRGNTVNTSAEGCFGYIVIGNNQPTGYMTMQEVMSGNTAHVGIFGTILADNIFSTQNDSQLTVYGSDANGDNLLGMAIVNNLAEKTTGTSRYLFVAADDTGAYTVNNVIIWNNTIVGQRSNLAYNDTSLNTSGDPMEADAAPRYFWSIKGNIFDDYNCVTDYDAHGVEEGIGRTGNKSVVHGVGFSSNVFCERTGAAGSYLPYFDGLKSIIGSYLDPLYVDDASATGTGLGGGDYHLEESSPARGLMFDQYIKYDIEGTERIISSGSAGVYEMAAEQGIVCQDLTLSGIILSTPTVTKEGTIECSDLLLSSLILATPTVTEEALSYEISDITKDNSGDILGGCTLYLFKMVSGEPVYQQTTTSDETTGEFSFTVSDDDPSYMIVARKDGTPNVFDVTDNDLTPVEV